MPKEISHWILAEKAAAALRESSIASTLVRTAPLHYPAHFLYGAVAPDGAFYYLFGKNRAGVRWASGRTHETDSATRFMQSSYMSDLMQQDKGGPFSLSATAFCLGVLSHYAADEAFHPLVDAMAPSTAEHYRLETRLDLFYLSAGPLPFTPPEMRTLLRKARDYCEACPLEKLCHGYLAAFAPGTGCDEQTAAGVLKMHAAVQRLFFSPLAPLFASPLRTWAPLFYKMHKDTSCPFDKLHELEANMVARFLRSIEKAALYTNFPLTGTSQPGRY
jgi:hypothetical protein